MTRHRFDANQSRVTRMVRPGVYSSHGVKNLGWFFRKARSVVIDRLDLWESNQGWERNFRRRTPISPSSGK
jgi:hypothetical protein